MNSDDPKFTAHVLGESEDLTVAERAEIDALIFGNQAAAAEAAETRALAARLRAELSGEAAAGLEERQRAAVLKAAASAVPPGRVVPFPRRTTALTAIAASLVVGVTAVLVFRQLREMPIRALPMTTGNLSEETETFARSSLGKSKALAPSMPPTAPAQQVQFGNITLAKAGSDRVSKSSMEMPSAPQLDALALNCNDTYAGATLVDAGTMNNVSGTFVVTTATFNQIRCTEFNAFTGTAGLQSVIAVTSTLQTNVYGFLNFQTGSAVTVDGADANRMGDLGLIQLAGLATR